MITETYLGFNFTHKNQLAKVHGQLRCSHVCCPLQEVIPGQICHMNMSLILGSYGAMVKLNMI